MAIRLSPQSIMRFLYAVVSALVVAHVAVQVLRFLTGDDRLHGLVFMFSLGAEMNLPAFYATFSLLFVALLLAAVGASSRADPDVGAMYWLGLSAVFVFLSMDEMLALHERLSDPVRSALGTSGLFFYAWVIPYGLAMLALAPLYVRFLVRLPRPTAVKFLWAGILFVAGAMGAEMVGGWYSEQHGNANPVFVSIQTVEEVLEMVGVLVFISALLEYADRRADGLRLYISSGASRSAGIGLAARDVVPPDSPADGRSDRIDSPHRLRRR